MLSKVPKSAQASICLYMIKLTNKKCVYCDQGGEGGGVSKLVFYAQSTGAVISGRTGGGGGGGVVPNMSHDIRGH